MSEHQNQIRRVERRYRRAKQISKWDIFRQRLPFLIVYVILVAAALIAIEVTSKQRIMPVSPGALRIYQMDVGQGDAALLCTDTHSILIDGGEPDRGNAVVQMIREAGISRLDCVINSHPHADHIGGIAAVLEQIPVGALYLPEIPDALIPTGWSFSHVLELAAEKQIPELERTRDRLKAQQEKLPTQANTAAGEYIRAENAVPAERWNQVIEHRKSLLMEHWQNLLEKLKEIYGQRFNREIYDDARRHVSDHLPERKRIEDEQNRSEQYGNRGRIQRDKQLQRRRSEHSL